MASPDHRALHDAENADFSAYLHTLTAEQWDKLSLCDGWMVRDVVGHILYGNEMRLWTLPLRLARNAAIAAGAGAAVQVLAARTSPAP